jgi:uncharacterized protein YcbK (DUF882 family)
LHLLEVLRRQWGRPLKFSSAYRCQAHNAATPGSAPTSYHVRGMAWDINLIEFNAYEREQVIRLGAQIFRYHYFTPQFLHVDIRGLETRTI